MQTYSLFIEDTRYTVPTLAMVSASDETLARRLAKDRLFESEHHRAVDVYVDDALLFRLDRDTLGSEA